MTVHVIADNPAKVWPFRAIVEQSRDAAGTGIYVLC